MNTKILCLILATMCVLTFSGCTPTKEASRNSNETIVKTDTISGIPVLRYYKNDGKKKPVVFSLHGYGGSKKNQIAHCEALANNGYYAVTLDAYGHGERTGGQLMNFAQVVTQYPKDIETVVNFLKNDSQADLTNMAMVGISMGAMASFSYATYGEIKPKILAPIIGTPDIAQLKGSELSKATYDEVVGRGVSTMPQEEIDAILDAGSSYKDYGNLKDIAIYMQNGSDDFLVHASGSQKLYNDLTSTGAQNVELVIYPGLNHWAHDFLWANANDYLSTHLNTTKTTKIQMDVISTLLPQTTSTQN